MRTSALFGAKNFEFFEIYAMFARTKEEGDQFFAILLRTSFINGPLPHRKNNKVY